MSSLYIPTGPGPWQFDDDNVSYDGWVGSDLVLQPHPTYDGLGPERRRRLLLSDDDLFQGRVLRATDAGGRDR